MAEPHATPPEDVAPEAVQDDPVDDRPTRPPVAGARAAAVPSTTAPPGAPEPQGPEPQTGSAAAPPDSAPPATAPEREQPTEPIAAATEPPAPLKRSNRLFATGMVLLSALLFEALYLAVIALLIVVLSGPSQVVPGVQSLVTERLVWVPLVIFVVLYELLVLLFNRAGRFVYVVASLIVGLAVYLGSVVVVVTLAGQSLSQDILRQVLISPEFVLAGLAAREVMLWTGFAIGAHGKRLRRKNRQARDDYEHELTDAD